MAQPGHVFADTTGRVGGNIARLRGAAGHRGPVMDEAGKPAAGAASPIAQIHVVAKGDTLGKIAAKY